ncbi:MAG: hypothetical protein ABEJ70_06495 [Halobacteriaceae archaeon]
MDIAEKRVYAERTGPTLAFVASEVGLVRVAVSDDLVGEFGVVHRTPVRDVAAGDGRLAVATAEDVLLASDDGAGPDLTTTAFGPAVAVGFEGDRLVAAAPPTDGDGGRVARWDGTTWTTLGTADVRAADGDLLATADGVRRVRPGLPDVGLDDVRDVAAAGPGAATAAGLFALGNGWLRGREGDAEVVTASRDGARAHAVVDGTLLAREDGTWAPCSLPVDGRVVDVAYAPASTHLVTADGTLLVDAGEGWRHRRLGVPDVRAVAVPTARAPDETD